MEKGGTQPGISLFRKRLATVILLLVAGCVVGGALSIPFVFESKTMWYKVGVDKTLLRAGQMAGLLAALSLFTQMLLGARWKFLEEVFGVAKLMRWHRFNGILLAVLVLAHVGLVLVPEGISNLPIGKKYWPEMVGGLLLWVILSMVISSYYRQQLGLGYGRWRLVHRMLAYPALVLVGVHVLFVSDSFAGGIPRTALIVLLVVLAVLLLQTKWLTWLKGRE